MGNPSLRFVLTSCFFGSFYVVLLKAYAQPKHQMIMTLIIGLCVCHDLLLTIWSIDASIKAQSVLVTFYVTAAYAIRLGVLSVTPLQRY